jgi:hypothetical protein
LIYLKFKLKINYGLKLDIRGVIGNKLTREKAEEYPLKEVLNQRK